MTPSPGTGLRWPDLTVWAVVNAVNLLQTAGFLSRVATRSLAANHVLGYVIMILVIPAAAATAGFARARSGWLSFAGPSVFLAFVLLMLVVDYTAPIEFRSPQRASILVPYLVLFFGAILLMGLPMFSIDRRLWLVTAVTTALLLGSMAAARLTGVG